MGLCDSLHAVRPFEVAGATVHHDAPLTKREQEEVLRVDTWSDAPLTKREQEEALRVDTWSASDSSGGGRRALLHGSHRLSRYSRCNTCRMLRCSRSGSFCTGHCRLRGNLLPCSATDLSPPDCRADDTLAGGPTDPFGPFDTAVIEVLSSSTI
eukprot:jgi/Ulvmu1/2082/UM123_0014.1